MDSDKYILVNGIPRPKGAVEAVDRLLAMVRMKPMWEVIDFIVSVFLRKHPEYLTSIKGLAKNKYGSNADKSMRSLLSIPMELKDTIDYFYKDEIKSEGEVKFWRKFAKKYPNFSLAEKI